jgi:O-methyltransferase involved in polyketide biosynthesis
VTLTHISDTARWVAHYRAMESKRPDAIFRDPFAPAKRREEFRRMAGFVLFERAREE